VVQDRQSMSRAGEMQGPVGQTPSAETAKAPAASKAGGRRSAQPQSQ
jgi:hypothetical protein